MIKIVKISTHVLSTIIIIVVVLPMVLSLILQNSGVQTWIVDKATNYISEKIGSRISIGRIDIGKFYNIELDDVFVESPMGRDTLLYTNKLTTRLSAFRLANNDMALAFVRLDGGEFNLYSADSVTNIKAIIDKIRGDAPKKKDSKPFSMSVGGIEIENLTFRYQKKDAEVVEYGINYQDMEMQNISMDLNEFKLVGDSIVADVKKITFREKGGIDLNNLSLRELCISSSVMLFKEGDITIDNDSHLKFKEVKMSYSDWNMGDFVKIVPIDAEITNSHINMTTVAKFTKQPRKWKLMVDFEGTFMGTIESMQGHVKHATVGGSVLTNVDYYIHNVVDIKNAIFDFTIGNLSTKGDEIAAIISDFSTSGDMKLPDMVVGSSPINIKGMFLGQMRNFDTECKLSMPNSSDGFLKANLNLSNKNGLQVDGSVILNNINTQKLIKNRELERLTANIYMQGLLNKENSDVTLKGKIDSLLFNQYNYHSIELNGALEKKAFVGYVGCSDPNLDFNFNGRIDFTNRVPSYNFNLDLKSGNLTAIGLNHRDSVSILSGRIMADGYGDNIDNLDATIVFDNLKYINQQDTTIADNEIRIEAKNNDESKSIEIISDYFDLSFRGVHSYSDLFSYIKKSSHRFLPALMPSAEVQKIITQQDIKSAGGADDYYVITLDVKKANNIANIFVPSLTLAEDSKLSFIFNPSADSFSLNVLSKYIFFDNNMLFNIMVDSKNIGDLVNFFARAEEVYLGSLFFPNFSVIGDVQNDVISADFGFSNSEDNTYALIKSKTTLLRPNGELQYKINMLPSTLNLYKDVWKSSGGEILIASKRITINDYSLVSTNQSLKVNGVVSGSVQDTLKVTLDNFSIKPLALFTSKIGFEVDGAISGEVVGSSLMNKETLFVDADLRFKKNMINGISLPDAYFHTEWEDFSRKLNFTLESDGEKYIWGDVKTREALYLANVKLPQFNIALIQPFLAGIAGNPVGAADVNVTLSNPNGYFEINGGVNIPSLDATIIPTNVRYNIAAQAQIKDNQYSLIKGVVKDADGGTGQLTAWMTNVKYKKVKYHIGVKADKMLGLNTTEALNTNFYGKAYATGDITIDGDRNNITLNVEATSSKRSSFVLPLGGRTLSEVSFIKFVSKESSTKDERRNMIQQREASKNPTSFKMKMRLTATPLLETEIVMDPLTGSSIKATGNGLLDIGIDPSNEIFTINGEYSIDRGTYRFILPNFTIVDKLFDIKSGSWIRWSGDPLGAILNVNATYKLKASLAPLLGSSMSNRVGVDCVLALKGALIQPDITLGIDVPDAGPEEQSALRSVLNTQEEISTQLFFLLVSNSFYATSGGATSDNNIGITGATTTGIEFLTNQIKNIFSSDKFDFGINYRPQSGLTSTEFEFDISAPIVNNKVFIDITGNYSFMDGASSSQKNWSGDVYLTWLLNNSGNLSLKGFSKVIDTFDENQGLQDSGVGIYFKADFDNFKDMKMRYKEYVKRRREDRILKKEKRIEKQTNKNK